METESNNVIPFLDVLLDNHNNTLDTITYSGLLVNCNSFLDWEIFPSFWIDKITKSSLGYVYISGNQSDTESHKARFYKILCIAKYLKQVQENLSKICKQFSSDVDLNFKINNYFLFKDETLLFLILFWFINLFVRDVILVILTDPPTL